MKKPPRIVVLFSETAIQQMAWNDFALQLPSGYAMGWHAVLEMADHGWHVVRHRSALHLYPPTASGPTGQA